MGEDPDVRWRQRFENFRRALKLLRGALQDGPEKLNLLEKEGTVQRFEYCFELGWKTIKDYLEAGGIVFSIVTPRRVIKDAYAAGLLTDGERWMKMLAHRIALSHQYDSATFENAVDAIARHYLPVLSELETELADK